ncbi:hypothetical protein ACSFC1_04825 [Pseudothermotoga sp. U03pept]|uniref:hypothetical protein n=1 Tax=Pseudothermotoga sp. U03pept TaxID=3447012 RepID=UPI003EFDA872
MNEESFQKFLDGELSKEQVDEKTREKVKVYTTALQLMKARYEYRPSDAFEKRIFTKVRRKKEMFSEVLIAVSVVAALFLLTLNVIPSRIQFTTKPQQASVSEVFDYLSLVKLVGDGF